MIIIIYCFTCFRFCLLFFTLQRLIPAKQFYDCHYFLTQLFKFNFVLYKLLILQHLAITK